MDVVVRENDTAGCQGDHCLVASRNVDIRDLYLGKIDSWNGYRRQAEARDGDERRLERRYRHRWQVDLRHRYGGGRYLRQVECTHGDVGGRRPSRDID